MKKKLPVKKSSKPYYVLAISTTLMILSLAWLRINLLTKTAPELRLSPPGRTIVIVMFSFFIGGYLVALGSFIYILKRHEPIKISRFTRRPLK